MPRNASSINSLDEGIAGIVLLIAQGPHNSFDATYEKSAENFIAQPKRISWNCEGDYVSVRPEKTLLKIMFLIVGVMFSWFTYKLVFDSTDNPMLAILAMGLVLAFWIGTLTVSIKGKF